MTAIYLSPSYPRFHEASSSSYLLGEDYDFGFNRVGHSHRHSRRPASYDSWSDAIRFAQAQAQVRAQVEAEEREYHRRQQQLKSLNAARARARAECEIRYYMYEEQLRERQRQRQEALRLETERRRKAQLAHQANHFWQAIGHQLASVGACTPRQHQLLSQWNHEAIAPRQAEAYAEKPSRPVNEKAETSHDETPEESLEQAFENLLSPFFQAVFGVESSPACTKSDDEVKPTSVDLEGQEKEVVQGSENEVAGDEQEHSVSRAGPSSESTVARDVPILSRSTSPAPPQEAREKVSAAVEASAPNLIESVDPTGSDASSTITTSSSQRGRSRSPRRTRVSDVDEEGNEIEAQEEFEVVKGAEASA